VIRSAKRNKEGTLFGETWGSGKKHFKFVEEGFRIRWGREQTPLPIVVGPRRVDLGLCRVYSKRAAGAGTAPISLWSKGPGE